MTIGVDTCYAASAITPHGSQVNAKYLNGFSLFY